MIRSLIPLGLCAACAFGLSISETAAEPGAGVAEKAAPAPALSKAESAQIKKDLEAVIAAVFKADMAPIAKHTHDKVFAIVGDKETFLKAIEQAFAQVKEAGVILVSGTVGDDLEYFVGDEHEYVLVSTEIVMEVAGQRTVNPGHQLGVKKKGEEIWKYIDCSALTTEMARAWFADFPKDKELPKPKQ